MSGEEGLAGTADAPTDLMEEEKRIRRLGILSWILPAGAFGGLFASTNLVQVKDMSSVEGIVSFAVIVAVLFFGPMIAGLVLAVTSRRRASKLHNRKLARHANIGLVVNVSLLVAYVGAFAVMAWFL